MLLQALAWLVLAVGSMAEYDLTFDEDPYLQYRPPFVRSLPVQILLTGVVLTLTTVLFLYLIFTAQYHWPLAPVNYILQVSSVTTLLISLIATLQVVLSTCNQESKRWPFMLSYVAVNVPPLDGYTVTVGWNIAERATWLIMNATTSGLIQITHIQFLTLLYPSKTEGVLIFSMLGPLAVLAAIMQLLPLQGSPGLDNIAAAIRNVCNATLSLLFTVALFVWGLLVNRDQAWRTDGGTAGFGSAALLLAVASTALTFLYIPREAEYVWLPGLIWAVVQWQSFLGWWWWVGAGSGTGMPRYDDSDYLEERERKREKRKRGVAPGESRGRARRAWQNVFASLSDRRGALDTDYDDSVHRRRRNSNSRSPPRTTPTTGVADPRSMSDVYSDSSGTLPRVLPDVVHRWYASLRKAHNKAARKQAMERVEYLRERQRAGAPPSTHTGWGLGSYGLRIRQEEGGEDSRHSHGFRSPPVGESIELSEMATGEDGNRLEHEAADDPANNNVELQQRTTAGVGRSVWWWGPLRRWRLQESIVY